MSSLSLYLNFHPCCAGAIAGIGIVTFLCGALLSAVITVIIYRYW